MTTNGNEYHINSSGMTLVIPLLLMWYLQKGNYAMSLYQFADFCIQIDNLPSVISAHMEDYCIDAPGNAAVDLYIDVLSSNIHRPMDIYRSICAYALAHDAFLMHCAVIEYEGRGYAFAAQSGTGKTTHIRLWQQLFGEDKVTIVNGDKPLLRLIDGVFYAYGTPWCGKEGFNTNTRVPLNGLCFIERGTQNSIRRISDEEAIPHLFSQIMVTDSTDLAKQMELADSLLGKVPCYLLTCNMEIDAARVAYDGMCKTEVKADG